MACKGRVSFETHPSDMNKSIVYNEGAASLEAAEKHNANAIKVGLDVHAKSYVGVVQYGHATPKPPLRFVPEEFLPWVERLLEEGNTVDVVYESCGFGFGLYRALQRLGAGCYVIAPEKLDDRNTRIKTDGRDARALCLRLSRYLAGNEDELAVIRVPSEEEEQARHVHRQREQLVHQRNRLEAQGRSLMAYHGQPTPAKWWHPRAWAALGKALPEWMIKRLEVYKQLLAVLDEQILLLTKELQEAAPQGLPVGLGKLTSVVLTREVCDWHRFNNSRVVASYTGLCPSEHSTGAKRVQGSVTKHGNPRLRAALIELAWRLVRFQRLYPPVHKRLAVLAKGTRATSSQRKKAIVAVARQLAIDLWRIYTGRATAQTLGLTC